MITGRVYDRNAGDHRGDRGDNTRDGDNRGDNNRGDNDRGDNNRGNHHRADNGRWDGSQHNGYMWRGRWHYGSPPSSYYGRSGFSPGYHAWRRGDRFPSYYRTRYAVVDYRAYHLRRPPRGYHYVRDDRGDILLVAITTGIILSLILGQH